MKQKKLGIRAVRGSLHRLLGVAVISDSGEMALRIEALHLLGREWIRRIPIG